MSELAELFNKYKCDKGDLKHKYYKDYEPYFEPVRNDPINILEIGTFKAASTSAFHEYFPNANIYTIDIFQRTNPEHLEVLAEERVHWMKADSMDAGLPARIRKTWGADIEFDFIIDDGAHYPEANRLTFSNCYPFLKQRGKYFIEDVWPLDTMSSGDISGNSWLQKHSDRYNVLKHYEFLDVINKNPTSFHDRRKETKAGDTYIIVVDK